MNVMQHPHAARLFFATSLLLPGFSLVAQASDQSAPVSAEVKKIIAEGIENSKVMDFQDHLCNAIGHRLTGSENFLRACNWAREEFEKMGLEARLDQWGQWKMGWDRGQWQGRVVAPFELELHVATPAWTGATRGQVTGRLVRMPEDLEQLGPLLKDGPVYLWGRLRRRQDAAKRAQLDQLQRAGKILGVVMSAASTGNASRQYENQIRVFGDSSVAKRKFENRVRLVQIVVRDDHSAKIEAALDGDKPLEVQFEIRNKYRNVPVKLYNVVAELRGTEFPDQYVVISGHLDSWHQAAGATDNGTGTCSTMEAARILTAAGIKPRRSIRFILWGGEEQGLLGSRGYVQRNRQSLKNVSAVFNHDNGTNWCSALTVTTAIAPHLQDAVTAINTLPAPDPEHDGPIFTLNAREQLRLSGGGSDHAAFSPALVPAFGWRLTGELPYGYGWHSQWDTYDLVEPTFQRHNATTFAIMAYTVAQLDQPLPRQGLLKPAPRGRGQAGMILSYVFGAEFKGLRVTSVQKSGFGNKIGMQKGDTIKQFNGKPVKAAADITRAMRAMSDGKIKLTIDRGGEAVELKGERQRGRTPRRGRNRRRR